MSASDITVGYPVHAVAEYRESITPNGLLLTDWRAACGATGQEVGHNPFKVAGSARWRELCPACWPTRHATIHPAPRKLA